MRAHSGSKNETTFWAGIALVSVGLVFLLDRVGWLTVELRTWWPLALVIIGALQFATADRSVPFASRSGIWLIVVGDWLLLNKLTILAPAQTWPLLMVAAGVLMILDRQPAQNNNIVAGQH